VLSTEGGSGCFSYCIRTITYYNALFTPLAT